ncbi:porin [Shewanella surugensis]|uniref:Porin n=1 Tax=Shewanella surugensis TaxID=212020 RepID=A0ABT0LCN4_9GAMM|nr:porin [Shewanella surugensis]MCL1124941.1 porin [Shewanella surugensis]
MLRRKSLLNYGLLLCIPFSSHASSLNVFGSINTAISHANTPYATKSKLSGTSLENSTTLGLKGSEAITANMHLLYKISVKVYNATQSGNTTPIKANSRYLGISNTFGTLLVGRNNTVFKSTATNMDIFHSTDASITHLVAGQTRSSDSINYYSPQFEQGLSFNSTYLMSANQEEDAQSNIQFALSTSLDDPHLTTRPYYCAVGYSKGIADIDAFRWVNQVKWRQFTLSDLYQYTQSQILTEKNMQGSSGYINLRYTLKNLHFNAEYGIDTSGLGDYFYNATGGSEVNRSPFSQVNITQIALGADYQLSHSTRLYCLDVLYQGHYQDANQRVILNNDNIVSLGIDYHF